MQSVGAEQPQFACAGPSRAHALHPFGARSSAGPLELNEVRALAVDEVTFPRDGSSVLIASITLDEVPGLPL